MTRLTDPKKFQLVRKSGKRTKIAVVALLVLSDDEGPDKSDGFICDLNVQIALYGRAAQDLRAGTAFMRSPYEGPASGQSLCAYITRVIYKPANCPGRLKVSPTLCSIFLYVRAAVFHSSSLACKFRYRCDSSRALLDGWHPSRDAHHDLEPIALASTFHGQRALRVSCSTMST